MFPVLLGPVLFFLFLFSPFLSVVSKTTGSVEVVATASPTASGLSRVTKATGSNAAPATRRSGASLAATAPYSPGYLVEEHRWGTPPAGTVGQLMDRLISRLDGPEPGLAGRWGKGGALSLAGVCGGGGGRRGTGGREALVAEFCLWCGGGGGGTNITKEDPEYPISTKA